METLAILIFSSFQFNLISYFDLSTSYNNGNILFSQQYLLLTEWEDGYFIYRNDRISTNIDFKTFNIVFGDFIPVIGFGYLDGYSSNSLSIQYFIKPKINVWFYLSPSNSYYDILSRGLYIKGYILKENLNLSFLYNTIDESYTLITGINLIDFNSLFFYKRYEQEHKIKVDNQYFENKNQLFYALNYNHKNILYIALEQKIFFLENLSFFTNWFLYIDIFDILSFKILHKEVYQAAQYYFSNGEFYQIIMNFDPILIGLYYKKEFYDEKDKNFNIEIYVKRLKTILPEVYFSFYYSFLFDSVKISGQNPYYSISINSKISKYIFLFLNFTENLLLIKLELSRNNQRFIIQLFDNINKTSSTTIGASQVSVYDSYDFYIPADSYGFGLYYFIYLYNLRLAVKFISTFSDNQLSKLYIYTGLFSSF